MKQSCITTFLTVLALAVAPLVMGANTSFYLDTDFQNGFEVVAPSMPFTVEGNLQWDASGGPPLWQLAQWDSQSSIFGISPTNTASGAFVYANADKDLTAGGGPTATESDLILTVNASNEYGGQYRSAGQPWPAMLVQQSISNPNGHVYQSAPSVAEMTSLNFNIDAKLLFDNRNIGPGYNSSIHASQFVHYLTIQNLNPASSGFGDFYWYGTNIYDDRFAVTPLNVQLDLGTNKLIYNTGIAPYTSDVVANGNWVNVNGDMLPHIKAGLQEAWNQGFLLDSQDMSDYYVGGSNFGWEIPGLNHASMQIRNLSLTAKTSELSFGGDGRADRVVISNSGGNARWAVDTSTATGFGDGVEDAAILFGLASDIHLLGDVNGDGLTDKIAVRDDGSGTWLWLADLSTPSSFGDGVADLQTTFGSVAAHNPLAVTDVNGDGQADRVLTDGTPNYLVDHSLGGLFGDGSPDDSASFGAPAHELIGMVDINGDGLSDRVINTAAPGALSWQADFSSGTAPNGVLGNGVPDTGATFGDVSHVKLLGDLNNDGFGDRVVVIDPLGNPAWQGDFSIAGAFGDGSSDIFQTASFGLAGDEFLLADIFAALIPGDFDGDGDVDEDDLSASIDGWEDRFGIDLNGTDFLTWQKNFGTSTLPLAATSAVPEPATWSLLLLAYGVLILRRGKVTIAAL